MYLKRLELQGFKSFADKTVLEFRPVITSVIGPNESGKSNISDAIRSVLGEQSMKSLGSAKVSIIIDNSDGKPNCNNYNNANISRSSNSRIKMTKKY